MRRPPTILFPGLLAIALLAGGLLAGTTVRAAHAPVTLGTADGFAVLAGTTVTNSGASVVNGDLGVSPGTAVTGFPPGTVNGVIHAADADAAQAQADLTTAYNDAAGRAPTQDLTGVDLGGLTLTDGTYFFSAAAQLTGTVTFDAQDDPTAVFIVQIGSTLTTATASSVSLINGADACNVFWQVGSSATLGTSTAFQGSILALTSITLNTGATIEDGRALARNGAVSLDTNVITRSVCAAAPEPTATPVPTATPTPIATPVPTATPTPIATPVPTATPTPIATPVPTATPTPIATATPAPTATVVAAPALEPSAAPTGPSEVTGTPIGTPEATAILMLVPAPSLPASIPDTSTGGGFAAQLGVIGLTIFVGLLALVTMVPMALSGRRDRKPSAVE
jgi:type VI secretion system secreted protein VgrG